MILRDLLLFLFIIIIINIAIMQLPTNNIKKENNKPVMLSNHYSKYFI